MISVIQDRKFILSLVAVVSITGVAMFYKFRYANSYPFHGRTLSHSEVSSWVKREAEQGVVSRLERIDHLKSKLERQIASLEDEKERLRVLKNKGFDFPSIDPSFEEKLQSQKETIQSLELQLREFAYANPSLRIENRIESELFLQRELEAAKVAYQEMLNEYHGKYREYELLQMRYQAKKRNIRHLKVEIEKLQTKLSASAD